MGGGGVEPAGAGDADDLACLLHTPERFASGIFVVAGGGRDLVVGVRGGAGVEEAQDGLALEGFVLWVEVGIRVEGGGR